MPYQPTNPSPYLATIDGTIENVFTCNINPRDVISKYTITVINNDNGTTVYTNTQTLTPPLRGTADNKSVLEISIPSNTIANSDYVWNIQLFDSLNKSVKSFDYFFKVRDRASVVVMNDETELTVIENNITSCGINITATYTQAQGVLPAWYRFNLYLDDHMVHTTDKVVSSNIEYRYDALINDNNYILELVISDDDKNQTILQYPLKVSYQYLPSFVLPTLTPNEENGCIELDYSDNVAIVGKYDEELPPPTLSTYKYTETNLPPENDGTNAVSIPKGQYLAWDETAVDKPLDLDNSNQIINWHGHPCFEGIIVEKYNPTLLLRKLVVGHTIPTNIQHNDDSEIYVDVDDPAMPIGVSQGDIQAGFYYRLGINSKEYIGEYTKVASARYKAGSSEITDEEIAEKIDDDTLYVLNDNDVLEDTDVLISNDNTNKYWWTVAMLKDRAIVQRSKKYDETVVS